MTEWSLRLVLAAPQVGFFPPKASTAAEGIDEIFGLIFWICAFFFLLIVAVAVGFAWRYRARRYAGAEESPSHNLRLELLWTGIPLALVVVIFGLSTDRYLSLIRPAKAAAAVRTIQVTGKKWSWWFEHPEGKASSELHLMVGQPVELVMTSPDVLHSLYVPAFRLKQDLVPGRYTRLFVTPTLAGSFPIYCAEYCGMDHSRMATTVVVHPDEASLRQWLNEKLDETMPLAELGALLYKQRGCIGCHSLDGNRLAGPSLKGLWGKQESLEGGLSATVDEDYVRESIVEPKAKVVAGFPAIMPPTVLSEREFQAVIEFIKAQK